MAKLTQRIIHCTATPEGMEVTPDMIRAWHMKPVSLGGRGWDRVGYSEMILLDGTVKILTPYDYDDEVDPHEITWGVKGQNSKSRHLVYVGGLDKNFKPKNTLTPEQDRALQQIVALDILIWPDIKIAGHNQYSSKACPSFDVPSWCRSFGVPEKNIYKKI